MFAELVANVYKQVTPYTAPQMARHVEEDNFASCYTSCINTACTIASIFGAGASYRPGEIRIDEHDFGFIDRLLGNDIVIMLMYPLADHYSCVIVHENICYLCESLQDKHPLKICVMSRHQIMITVNRYTYEVGSGQRRFDYWPLNGDIQLSVRKFRCHPFTKKERQLIKKCKAHLGDYEPEILRIDT